MRGRRAKKNLDKEPDDHALGRSKGGFTTKIHVKTDGQGHVLGIVLTAGQCHESTQFEAVMEAEPLPVSSGDVVAMENGNVPSATPDRPKAVAW
jgi:hypothetical protein